MDLRWRLAIIIADETTDVDQKVEEVLQEMVRDGYMDDEELDEEE